MDIKNFSFADKLRALGDAKVELPMLLANQGQTYFQKNFDKAQWDGTPWEERKDSYNTKALLVASSRTRQALQNTIRDFNWSTIMWSIPDVPYAKYLQEGTEKMPARKIIGISDELHRKFENTINRELKKVLEA